jgi:predicted phage-related endonuclease
MRVIDCEQGDDRWLAERRGRITASRIADVLDVLKKGGEGAQRRNYRFEVAAERTTGRSSDKYVSPEMKFGTGTEPFARAEYEIEMGLMVSTVGFVIHPTLDYTGSSPDGLVGNNGGIEIKCGKSETHLKWLDEKVVPEEHRDQMQWNMACTERSWWDFISYDPRQNRVCDLFIVRLERDEAHIKRIEAEVTKFHEEVEALLAGLPKRVKPAPPVESAPDIGDWAAQFESFTSQEIVP